MTEVHLSAITCIFRHELWRKSYFPRLANKGILPKIGLRPQKHMAHLLMSKLMSIDHGNCCSACMEM